MKKQVLAVTTLAFIFIIFILATNLTTFNFIFKFTRLYKSVIYGLILTKVTDPFVERELKKLPPVDAWQTYTDSQLGLSFRYPPGWTVEPITTYSPDYYGIRVVDYTFSSHSPRSQVTIVSTTDPVFRKVQIEGLVARWDLGSNTSAVLDGRQFVRLQRKGKDGKETEEYYLDFDEEKPLKIRLLNHYGIDHSRQLELTLDGIFDQFIHSLKFTSTTSASSM